MKTLVLLEEDREGRETLSGVLRQMGYSVIPAGSEEAALKAVGSSRTVHLVLAGAADRDRLAFLADVREQRPRMPVLLLSDYCEPESRLRGLLYGAFAALSRRNVYINVRPFSLVELAGLLRCVLRGRRTSGKYQLAAA